MTIKVRINDDNIEVIAGNYSKRKFDMFNSKFKSYLQSKHCNNSLVYLNTFMSDLQEFLDSTENKSATLLYLQSALEELYYSDC